MIVNNCNSCIHFVFPGSPQPDFGICKLAGSFRGGGPHYGESMAIAVPDAEPDVRAGAELHVHRGFCCIQFERSFLS